MKLKRVIRSGDKIAPAVPASENQIDWVLNEIARLYRERFRALYNGDQATLKTVDEQIELLKSKLPRS